MWCLWGVSLVRLGIAEGISRVIETGPAVFDLLTRILQVVISMLFKIPVKKSNLKRQ